MLKLLEGKKEKTRIIIFLFLHVLICVSVILYTIEFKDVCYAAGYVANVNVDGTDFTGIVNLGILGFNGFISTITIVGYIIAMLLISVVLMVPFRLIAIRKKTVVSHLEVKMVRYIMAILIVFAIIVGVIVVGRDFLAPMILMFVFPVLLELVLYRESKPSKQNLQ